jgi:uncharacterized membrane protein
MTIKMVWGGYIKSILFGNKRIRAITYDGVVVYIPIEVLSELIHHTRFDVKQENNEIIATDFHFVRGDK